MLTPGGVRQRGKAELQMGKQNAARRDKGARFVEAEVAQNGWEGHLPVRKWLFKEVGMWLLNWNLLVLSLSEQFLLQEM